MGEGRVLAADVDLGVVAVLRGVDPKVARGWEFCEKTMSFERDVI